jgi:tungstate transport system substrate-binding protein
MQARPSPALQACVLVLALATGCSRPGPTESITLATTTSAQDSGLLDVLVPRFRQQTGIEVKVVAVGTGQALELGRRGDADAVLVHAPAAEQRFMEEGHGASRRAVMVDRFILVGPPADPAGVKGQASVVEAFTRIAGKEAPFVSRGDESGTHIKEKAIWQKAGVEPRGAWYIAAGAGMAQTLRMAGEKRAYTLTDRGTYLAQGQGLDLTVLCEGDPLLVNPYSVITVNPERHPGVHAEAARKFADFLVSPGVQETIADFGRDRFGEALFTAGATGREEGR